MIHSVLKHDGLISKTVHLCASLLLFSLIAVLSCSNQERPSKTTQINIGNSAPKLLEGILYARADTAELKLNITFPADTASLHPLLIFIHGGGWQTGHRDAYNSQIMEAAEHGFAAATISHRYTRILDESGNPIYRWPLPLQDVQAAIRFLRTNAAEFHLDPDRFGILGASSGAHLAMMAAFIDTLINSKTTPVVPGDEDAGTKADVKAVANISGPVDLVSAYDAPVVTPFLDDLMDGNPQTLPELYRQASPVHHLSQNDPPLLTLHGELDDVVPVEQAYLIDREMRSLGLNHELVIFENQGHIFEGDTAANSWLKIYDFFHQHL